MLGKLFKRSRTAEAPAPQARQASAPAATHASAPAIDKAAWHDRVQAAQGDDAALLALAREAPLHDLRLAAVQALSGDEALKQAEHLFRGHDKALHRAARQALDARARQREARQAAAGLLATARALAQEATSVALPANRLVDLHRAWQALDATLLEDAQRSEFAELQQTLAQLTRAHGERQRDEQRRSAAIAAALAAEQAAQATAVAQAAAEQQQRVIASQMAHQQARAQSAAQTRQARAALEKEIAAAETALSGGHLNEVAKQLAALREAAPGIDDAALHARLQALQGEYARLKGWQNWGGTQARETLVQEAEQLAQLAADTDGARKLALKQHADDIDKLRARWKELDHLGSPPNQALWKRFDAALQTAWLPVAAQQQKLKEARAANLQERQALLAKLEATPLPGEQATTPSSEQQAGDQATARLPGHRTTTTDWHGVAHALEHFHGEWRKLGPVEHTVAQRERSALQQRLAAAVARLEAPLQEARRRARDERLALIASARALAAEAHRRDLVERVRTLQGEWQRQAKAQPLARKDEHALWAEFKAATDALFAERSAAHQAREAELHAHQVAREALIAELTNLAAATQTPANELKRRIAELDAQWRAAGPAPKPVAARLDAAWRSAHQQLQQQLAHAKAGRWHAACDALLARLELCEAAESGDAQDAAAHWAALAPAPANLPAAWLQAVQQRFAGAASAQRDDAALDAALLQLEAALDIASPPDFQNARRELKLQAMKRAMERHQPDAAKDIIALAAAALAPVSTNAQQRERLRTALAALRTNPPVTSRE